jgi:hypothetical protein
MVFIRSKRIKGKEYYYLVKSTRIKGRVKQTTLKYLGSKIPPKKETEELKKKYEEQKK